MTYHERVKRLAAVAGLDVSPGSHFLLDSFTSAMGRQFIVIRGYYPVDPPDTVFLCDDDTSKTLSAMLDVAEIRWGIV